MKIDLEKLKQREKYIGCQQHSTLPLLIWNYTNPCQFENAWDEYTIQARGLITDLEGNIVARPFKKFFNLNQTDETKLSNLVNLGEPKIYEKLDGSLGIQYYDNALPTIATRGSFVSEQADWATKWIRGKFTAGNFLPGYTYLYEIIYPENRIVVDYNGRKELVLLAVIHTDTGEEIDYVEEAKRLGLGYAQPFDGSFGDLLIKINGLSGNEEGFVLQFNNGLRVKIKGEEYVRLHRLITGFSNKSIWECLANGQGISEFLEKVPDEFYEWVRQTEADLKQQFENLAVRVGDAYKAVCELPDRKSQALQIMADFKDVSAAIFTALDNKDPSPFIWKMIKPKYSKPFRKDIDL